LDSGKVEYIQPFFIPVFCGAALHESKGSFTLLCDSLTIAHIKSCSKAWQGL